MVIDNLVLLHFVYKHEIIASMMETLFLGIAKKGAINLNTRNFYLWLLFTPIKFFAVLLNIDSIKPKRELAGKEQINDFSKS